MTIILTTDELERVTGYKTHKRQVKELHRQGFYRARRTAEGLAEVRGIYLPLAQHAHIKRLAALLGKPTEPPKEQT